MHRKLKIVNRKSKIENRFAGFTPLEIPKRASLERQAEQPLIARVTIGDKKQRFLTGFTLTEVVVASALLIIAMVPILKALTSAHVTSTIIERRTRSLTLAQAKLDDIRARSIYHWGLPTSFRERNTSLDGSYLCTVIDIPTSPNLRQIAVAVGYDQNGNSVLDVDEVEVTLATLVAKRL